MSFVNFTSPAGALSALRVSVRLTSRTLSEASLTDATSLLRLMYTGEIALRPQSIAHLASYLQLDPAHIADLDAEGVKALVEYGDDSRTPSPLAEAAQQLDALAAERAARYEGREQQLQREEIEARLGEIPADPNDVEAGEPPTITAIELTPASTRPSDIRRAISTSILWMRSNPAARVVVAVSPGKLYSVREPLAEPAPERTADDVAGHDA